MGKQGPEAEQAIAKLLAANVQNPERNENKPDLENAPIDVVTNENPPSAPVGEPPSNTPAPSDEPKDKEPVKKAKKSSRKGRA